jgi:hypothetical protein
VIPPFDPETGRLPEGEHEATWDEVVDRLGWTARRRQLLDGLAEAVELLAAAGCGRLWLNGSFVTAKHEPVDFDACWDPAGVDLLDPVFLDLSAGRHSRRHGSVASWSPTSWNQPAGWCSPDSSRTNATAGAKASSSC